MIDNTKAILNGIATTTMQEMLRKGELFKLPSSLTHFILNEGWKAVEYVEPETNSKKVATFDGLLDWVSGSPARGGLGSRLDTIVKLVSQPLDVEAAPECCNQLLNALDGMEAQAMAPLIAVAATANAKLTPDKQVWNAVVDKATKATQLPHGANRHTSPRVVQCTSLEKAPTGNSTAAGLRKLRRYADSESLCQQNGIDQANVTEQYGKTLRGEKSVHRALIDSGLKKKQVKSLWIGDPATMAQRIVDGMGRDKAAELITHLTTLLAND
jgi:hypothetical protein